MNREVVIDTPDLFSAAGESVDGWAGSLREVILREAGRVPGLAYLPEFIDAEEEARLIERVDSMQWSHEYSRRRQHYGKAYYAGQEERTPILPMPDWLRELAERMTTHPESDSPSPSIVRGGQGVRAFREAPGMALVNEYLPGQGIAPHMDHPDSGDTVVSLSLGSACVMEFTPTAESRNTEHVGLWLEPRSLIVMQGEARFGWHHGIAKRRTDRFHGRTLHRTRRVSITFRGTGG